MTPKQKREFLEDAYPQDWLASDYLKSERIRKTENAK